MRGEYSPVGVGVGFPTSGSGGSVAPTATGPVYTTVLPFFTVMVCAPRATSMWNGFAVIVTSDDLIQPVLPFGRTGSSTCTQPSLRSSFTRKTCVTVDVGTSGSYNHGLSNSRAGVDAPGE